MSNSDRAWGTGSVTPHGSKWRARLPLTHKRRSLGIFETRVEAERVLAAALGQLVDAPLDALTLAAWGERWLQTRDVRAGTLARDVTRWRCYVGRHAIGARALADIARIDVEAWLASTKSLAVQTRRNALGLVRQALEAATQTGGPLDGRVSPAVGVKLGKRAAERTKEPWTWLRLDEVDAALSIDTAPLRSRLFWTISIYSGLRPGELCGLRWEGVDFERGIIHVEWSRGEAPKNGRPREVPMLAPARIALERWRDLYTMTGVRSHLGLVFPSRSGGYHADGYDAGWSVASKGTPLARASIYDFRHTCASHLLQGSWAPTLLARPLRLEEVRDWLGHSDIKVTQRYAHLSPESIAGLVTPWSPDRSRPRDLNSGPTVYEGPALARVGAEMWGETLGVSSPVTRLRAAGVKFLDAVARGDRHALHRGVDVVAAMVGQIDDAHEREAAKEGQRAWPRSGAGSGASRPPPT